MKMENQKVNDAYIKRSWDENADQYFGSTERAFDLKHTVFPAVRSLAGDLKGRKALDAGCGPGDAAIFLNGLGAKTSGVDISTRMIEIARSRNADGDIAFEEGNLSSLSQYKTETFDLTVCHCVLFELPDMRPALSELARALKPGGRLIVSVYHPCFWSPGRTWVDLPPESAESRRARAVEGYFDVKAAISLYIPLENLKSRHPTYTFHRPISELVSAVMAAGLSLEKMLEPAPGEEGLRRLGQSFWAGKLKIPDYLFLSFRKP